MQSTTPTIKRVSFITALSVFFFSSGALLGRTVPAHEAGCPVASETDGTTGESDRIHASAALPGAAGGLPAYVQGSDGSIIVLPDTAESTCPTVRFEDEKGDGMSLGYDQFDAIAWNGYGTVLVVEHPARHVIIEGERLELLRERLLKHACGVIAATELPAAEDGGASASEEAPDDVTEPFITRVRFVTPDSYHFGKQNGEYVSGEEYP